MLASYLHGLHAGGPAASGAHINLAYEPPKAAFRSTRLPPGAEPPAEQKPAASKNARKRASKSKNKDSAASQDAGDAGASSNGQSAPAHAPAPSTSATSGMSHFMNAFVMLILAASASWGQVCLSTCDIALALWQDGM